MRRRKCVSMRVSMHVSLYVSGGVPGCARCWKGGLCSLDVHRGWVVARVPSEAGLGRGWGSGVEGEEAGAGGGGSGVEGGGQGWEQQHSCVEAGGLMEEPGRRPAQGSRIGLFSLLHLSQLPPAEARVLWLLKLGRAEVTRLWTPGQILHFTEG